MQAIDEGIEVVPAKLTMHREIRGLEGHRTSSILANSNDLKVYLLLFAKPVTAGKSQKYVPCFTKQALIGAVAKATVEQVSVGSISASPSFKLLVI